MIVTGSSSTTGSPLTLQGLVARLLLRSVDVIETIDFSPSALRADIAGERRASEYLYSAAELIDRAADLLCESAVLVQLAPALGGRRQLRWRKRFQANLLGAQIHNLDHIEPTLQQLELGDRIRLTRTSRVARQAELMIFEPGYFLMERGMLRGWLRGRLRAVHEPESRTGPNELGSQDWDAVGSP